jgi:hypothetical protein
MCLHEWRKYWLLIEDNMKNKMKLEMSNKCKTLDRKLNRLIILHRRAAIF